MISVGGARAGSGGLLAAGVTETFTTGSFSTLRLQQLFGSRATGAAAIPPPHRPAREAHATLRLRD